MGHYSAMRRNEALTHALTWTRLRNMAWRGRRQAQNAACRVPSSVWSVPEQANAVGKQIAVARGRGRGGVTAGGCRV